MGPETHAPRGMIQGRRVLVLAPSTLESPGLKGESNNDRYNSTIAL